ncbi:zf-HC2 domain-containing protein [Sporolactobacillus sp. Y61]|uniref:Anti-sigma-W factor RsiW n=1 Tax=Sporolactobacillus sp. Y61 TaxID=3160863 RepID=A0AAU8IGA9_9BACL
MTCSNKKYLALMNKVMDGEATISEREELDQHLASCDSCRNYFHELQLSTELLHQLSRPRLPDDFTQHVMERLPAEKRHAIRTWTSRHPLLSAVVVCALPVSYLMVRAGRQNQLSEKNDDHFIMLKLPGERS